MTDELPSIHDKVTAYLDDAISNARDNLYDISREIDAGVFGEGGLKMRNACYNDLRALVRVRNALHKYNDDRYKP